MRSSKVKAGKKLVIETIEREPVEGSKLIARTSSRATAADTATTTSSVAATADITTASAKVTDQTRSTAKTATASSKPATSKAAAPARPTTYKVRKGDNLGKIARNHGVTIAALQAANGMSASQTRIDVGQVLKIPAPAPKKKSTRRKK